MQGCCRSFRSSVRLSVFCAIELKRFGSRGPARLGPACSCAARAVGRYGRRGKAPRLAQRLCVEPACWGGTSVRVSSLHPPRIFPWSTGLCGPSSRWAAAARRAALWPASGVRARQRAARATATGAANVVRGAGPPTRGALCTTRRRQRESLAGARGRGGVWQQRAPGRNGGRCPARRRGARRHLRRPRPTIRDRAPAKAAAVMFGRRRAPAASPLDSWPATALRARRPEHNTTAIDLHGLTRCEPPQHLPAEEHLQDFAAHHAAFRGIPNADWRCIA